AAQVANGFVVGISLTYGGYGYTNAPAVRILGGGGSGALAQAVIKDGFVVAIQMLNAGTGYMAVPDIEIQPPALPSAPSLSLAASRLAVAMHLARGFTYQLESSRDSLVWLPVGVPFFATSDIVTKEFVIAETGQYFRVRLVK
ncbi:MAG TPA: hypothetical protein VMB21_11890, partial [Candidatus Limnocylindria bacterium]|nr:hypothetical protein [Candidatus Limnocylindria bacterium]